MELRKIIQEIQRIKDWSQDTLAVKLGTNQSTVSQMKQGAVWQHHLEIFLRLMPLCLELDLIGEQELLGTARHDVERASKDHSKGKAEKVSPHRRKAGNV